MMVLNDVSCVVSWSVSDRLVAAETLTSTRELLRLNKTHFNKTTVSLSVLSKSVILLVEVGNPPHTFSSSCVQSGLDEAAQTDARARREESRRLLQGQLTAAGLFGLLPTVCPLITCGARSTIPSYTHLFLDIGHLIGSRFNQQKALQLQLDLSFIWLVKFLSGFKPSYLLIHERFKSYICEAMF